MKGFFFSSPLPHTHPNPSIFASANGRVGSREAEALGHKEDFSYCAKQAPEHLPQNQTKDGICRRRMTTPKHSDPHPARLRVLRVPKYCTFAFYSSAAANWRGCLRIPLQPLALRSDTGPEKMMLVLAVGGLEGSRGLGQAGVRWGAAVSVAVDDLLFFLCAAAAWSCLSSSSCPFFFQGLLISSCSLAQLFHPFLPAALAQFHRHPVGEERKKRGGHKVRPGSPPERGRNPWAERGEV